MEKLYSLAHSVRAFLFCNPTDRRIRKLDPGVRAALVDTIVQQQQQEELYPMSTAWQDELNAAKQTLQSFLEKEQFLSLRHNQYRKKLDARGRQLTLTDPEYEAKLEQWEEDQETLDSIAQTQKNILIQCELMRRKIRDLEGRKQEWQRLHHECQDFVEASQRQTPPTTIVNGPPQHQHCNGHDDEEMARVSSSELPTQNNNNNEDLASILSAENNSTRSTTAAGTE